MSLKSDHTKKQKLPLPQQNVTVKRDVAVEQKQEVDIVDTMSSFGLVELSTSTIRHLMAHATMQESRELEKDCPDQARLKRLNDFYYELHALDHESANYSNHEKMRSMIRKYTPLTAKLLAGESII